MGNKASKEGERKKGGSGLKKKIKMMWSKKTGKHTRTRYIDRKRPRKKTKKKTGVFDCLDG